MVAVVVVMVHVLLVVIILTNGGIGESNPVTSDDVPYQLWSFNRPR